MKTLFCLLFGLLFMQLTASAASTNFAANSINQLGIDLFRQTKPNENTVISPYSIQSAMAMAYEGADGPTRAEMAKVLHYPSDDKIRDSLKQLRETLHTISTNSQIRANADKRSAEKSDPFILTIANRLFGQTGFEFRPPFLSVLQQSYAAPFEALDFRANPTAAANHINSWVKQQTHDRISNLISPTALNALTRLVLVNAVYLKVPWMYPFKSSATKPEPFHAANGKAIEVPTMIQTKQFGYGQFNDVTAVVLHYRPSELQFVILLPNSPTSLDQLVKNLSPDLLGKCATLETKEINLHLPKFKLQPPLFNLKQQFEMLGMKQAFNMPPGSANFDRIAPRKDNDYLYISDIFHKTFIDVDEKGTEAAAATAITMVALGIRRPPQQPIEVRIDHPFLFAIQHRGTGACLFLGRVTDPTAN